MSMKTYITNEGFREGCRCRRLFWLNMKNGGEQGDHCPALTALAREYIRGGASAYSEDKEERAANTLELIKSGEKIIKAPAFIIGGVAAEADILYIKKGIPHIYFS